MRTDCLLVARLHPATVRSASSAATDGPPTTWRIIDKRERNISVGLQDAGAEAKQPSAGRCRTIAATRVLQPRAAYTYTYIVRAEVFGRTNNDTSPAGQPEGSHGLQAAVLLPVSPIALGLALLVSFR